MKSPIEMSLVLVGMLFVGVSAWAQDNQSFKFECVIRGQGERDWVTLSEKTATLDPGKEATVELSFTTPENQQILLSASASSFLQDIDLGNGNRFKQNVITDSQKVSLPNNKIELYDMSEIGMADEYRGGSLVGTSSVVKFTTTKKTYMVSCSVHQ